MGFDFFFFFSNFSDSIENLPKLVEDIVQTSINTGPRGALRMAQGIQAVIGVGGEWLSDMSKVIGILNSIVVRPGLSVCLFIGSSVQFWSNQCHVV